MRLPRVVEELVASFEKLPGIGGKSAQRLAFYLLRVPQRELDSFSSALSKLKKDTKLCEICHNISENDRCKICSDTARDQSVVCVVEGFQDVVAIENSNSYKGVYHVLHGAISPLNNVGPEEIFIGSLMKRLGGGDIQEVILATNTSLEGEATAMYIAEEVERRKGKVDEVKTVAVSRIGRGLPTGVDLEYADDMTLNNAINSRRRF